MTEDDWSLKGKEKTRCVESHDGTDWDDCYKCFDEDDIETLRQKLIEDIKTKISYPYVHGKEYVSKESYKIGERDGIQKTIRVFEGIINKRFGVE